MRRFILGIIGGAGLIFVVCFTLYNYLLHLRHEANRHTTPESVQTIYYKAPDRYISMALGDSLYICRRDGTYAEIPHGSYLVWPDTAWSSTPGASY